MSSMGTQKDYLKDYPEPKLTFLDSDKIKAEVSRVGRGEMLPDFKS